MGDLIYNASRLVRMGPREIAVRLAEKWWGWRERLSVLRSQASSSAALAQSQVHSVLQAFCQRPFHAFTAGHNRSLLLEAFHRFFPGRMDSIRATAEPICQGSVSLFGQWVRFVQAPDLDWHLDWETGERWPVEFYRDIRATSNKEGADVKRVWETNRQQFLVTLGKGYFLTGNAKHARRALALMGSWIEANPPYRGVNWKEALEAGFRLLSWLWTLRLIAAELDSDSELARALVQSLGLQRDHIERHISIYSSPNTHLLGEVLALFVVGLMWPELPRARCGATKALHILEQELDRQVADDGSHREKSAYYHCYALEMYLLATVLGRQHGVSFSPRWMKRVEAMAEFLMHILRPDGTLARFGDDDGGKTLRLADEDYYQPRSLLGAAAVLFNRPDFKHVASELPEEAFWLLGAEGAQRYLDLQAVEPANVPRWFPDAQVGILRSGWNRSDLWCACQQDPMGMHTAGHSHASILSFELFMAGEPLVIDPGTCTYAAAGPWRDYFRSLEAHNTMQIAGEGLYHMAGQFRWENRDVVTPSPATHLSSNGLQLGYTTEKFGGGPIRHARTFQTESNHSITIEDVMEGSGTKALSLWLHFAPGWRVEKCGEDEFEIRQSGKTIRLLFRGFGRPRYQMWEGSEKPLAGWCSLRFGCRIPSTTLCVEEEAALPARRSMHFQVVMPQAGAAREESAATK